MELQNHGNEGKKEKARRNGKKEKKTMVALLAEKKKNWHSVMN